MQNLAVETVYCKLREANYGSNVKKCDGDSSPWHNLFWIFEAAATAKDAGVEWYFDYEWDLNYMYN